MKRLLGDLLLRSSPPREKHDSLETLLAAGDQVSIIQTENRGGRSWSWTTVADLIDLLLLYTFRVD